MLKYIADEYLQSEISLRHVGGPFPPNAIRDGHVSQLIIPKNHQPNKWRLAVYLSCSMGHSVNYGIPPPLYSLHYVTIDDAANTYIPQRYM